MRLHWVISAIVLLSISSVADAQRRGLSVGDNAPDLTIGEWLHGQETSITSDNVYVVVFWATWCRPCVQSIPKLSRMQRQYRDEGLVIIGVSDEDKDDVQSFLRRRARDIEYRIAIDERNRTKRAWMRAANRDGIPSAFIVDRRGRIQFIGSPHNNEFEFILELVLMNRYDARLFERAEPILEAANNARKVRNWNQAMRRFDQVVELDEAVFAPITIHKFEMLLVDMDEKKRAYEYARELIETYSADGYFLVNFARFIAENPDIPDEKRDMKFALEVANQAANAVGENHPIGLAVRARIHYQLGDVDQAISLQRRAWMVASPERKGDFERALQAYRDTRSRRESRVR